MAMVCDACGEKYGRDSVNASSHLHVSPPRPDFKLYQALTAAGQSYESREPLTLDLCLSCTRKVLTQIGLSTEICDLPELPKTNEETGRPNAGALTDEDLRQLGLVESSSAGPKA
jgi:hypothetical protein